MKRFTKTQKALGALTDTILGDSTNVVRTLKVAGHMNEDSVKHVSEGYARNTQSYSQLRSSLKKFHSTRDQVMQIMDYLDNIEEEYHKIYPNDPCPMEGGYKASFERFVIESIGAEWDLPPETE